MSRPSPTSEQVGRVVRSLREASHQSQEAVADAAEISRYYYSRIELGDRNPTLLVLARIAQALETTLSDLIDRAEKIS